MLMVWVVWNYGTGVEGVFPSGVEANAAALIVGAGAEAEEYQVTELVAWLHQRAGTPLPTSALPPPVAPVPELASVADAEDVSPEELERREAEAQAAWLARDRSNDPPASADVTNVHTGQPGCVCLGCRVSGPIDWNRVVPQS